MADLDYNDISDPILDISTLSMARGDSDRDEDIMEDDVPTDGNILEGYELYNEDHQKDGGGDEHTPNNDDDDPMGNTVDEALEMLREICDSQGVACTGPMENMVRAHFKNEAIFYSSLLWMVRGVSVATQTQVVPTVMSAISDMKVENRLLQQSSHRINNDVEKATRMTADIVEQLNNFRRDLTDSFRKSVDTLIDAHERQMKKRNAPESITLQEGSPPPRENPKLTNDRVYQGIPDEVFVNTETVKNNTPETSGTKPVGYINDKKIMVLKLGYSNKWVQSIGLDLLDTLFDDDLYIEASTMKLTAQTKKFLKEIIDGRLEDMMRDD
ncbi:phosphoprotein [Chrysanthemum yellow dwarf virus]|uniref:Phosphoprotein n=1 Tax=chrysanthemum yellow dwarf associated virus TaxID=3070829 RepID=A0AAE7QPP0_9RHAB|nr:phosphoprotein [Chrysanthemum yellow dwarf virus]QRX38977.1 phosphoprotein [Chrysanthemum yellow dwarf virus]